MRNVSAPVVEAAMYIDQSNYGYAQNSTCIFCICGLTYLMLLVAGKHNYALQRIWRLVCPLLGGSPTVCAPAATCARTRV